MIGPNSRFEVPVNWNLKGKTLSGLIDCIDNKILYEFKCTKDVEKEHYIQCALYMYLCKVNEMEIDKFLLFNILTGEIFEIESDLERLEKMVSFLFEHKFSEKVTEIDEVLLEKLKEIQKRY
jgi:CRISPR/Cas system-associated exonuclease Cas4 (RecB family)